MNNNYIFIFEDISYTKIQYNDLNKSSNAYFLPLKTISWKKDKKTFKNFFCHLHLSETINKKISLPFKNIWSNYLFNFSLKESLNKTLPFCFIIDARCYEKYGFFLIKYLKKKFNNCKIVLYFTDLLKTYRININNEKKHFDFIFSFELNDAMENSFFHYDSPYSKLDIISDFPKSDIFFVGNDKNRLKTIIYLYEMFTDKGITCDFNIAGVKKKEQYLNDKINYIDFMDYKDVIKHIISTDCILEILQEDGENPTLRSLEAVCYNKKLLTNCVKVKNKGYYNPEYISIFDNLNNINIDFVKNKLNFINYNYQNEISPLSMIRHIDDNIQSYLK